MLSENGYLINDIFIPKFPKTMKFFKIAAFTILLVEGIIMITTGIGMQDILEVISNGSILCLSCVGIG